MGDPQPMALEAMQWLALGWDVGDAEDGSLLPSGFGANGANVEVGIRLRWDLGWGLRGAASGGPSAHGFGAKAVVGIWVGWDLGWGLQGAVGGGPSTHGFGGNAMVGIGLGWDLGWGLQVLWMGDPQPMALVGIGLGCG